MASMTEDRVEVGLSDLGNVFVFHKAEKDVNDKPTNDTWMVRAGNHTVGTYTSEAGAFAVARALCGDDRLNNAFVAAPEPEPAVEEIPLATETAEYVTEVRKKVNKK